jgi:ribosome-associated protein
MKKEEIGITTEYIKLDQLLKLAGLTGSGAEAKKLIRDGYVTLNGEVCTSRNKKIYPSDIVVFDDEYCWFVVEEKE